MRTTVVLTAIIGMYLLLCGCPYSTTTSMPTPLLTPDPSYSLDNSIIQNSSSFPEFNHSNPVRMQFALKSPVNQVNQPYNVYDLGITCSGGPYQNLHFSTCTFSTVENNLVMEAQDDKGTHYFAVMVINKDMAGRILSLEMRTLPSTMPLNADVYSTISAYLGKLNQGLLPGNTDGGYDGDSEIKSIAF